MELISSPSAELFPDDGVRAWFCLRTQLKHEHIAAAHLRQFAGVEVFNPQLRLLRSTRQGRKWFTESLFPNYVFARFDLELTLEKVTYTPGVKAVLRFGDRVPEIPEGVIEDLRQSVTGLDARVLTDAPVEGEEVEIAAGAFAGLKAEVTRVLPGKQRAEVLVEIMGRLVPAKINLDQVLFNRRDVAQMALPPSEPMIEDGTGISSSAPIQF